MIEFTMLASLAVSTFFIALAPGPGLTFLLSVGAAYGQWAGVRAAAGAAVGVAVHVAVVTLGLAAIVNFHPSWLGGLHLAAAGYLIFLGVGMIRAAATADLSVERREVRSRRLFSAGVVNSVSNVSSLLFVAALLPEFTDPARGSIRTQLLALGVVFTVVIWAIETGIGVLAGSAHAVVVRYPALLKWLSIVSGAILCILAILSAWEATALFMKLS